MKEIEGSSRLCKAFMYAKVLWQSCYQSNKEVMLEFIGLNYYSSIIVNLARDFLYMVRIAEDE